MLKIIKIEKEELIRLGKKDSDELYVIVDEYNTRLTRPDSKRNTESRLQFLMKWNNKVKDALNENDPDLILKAIDRVLTLPGGPDKPKHNNKFK